MSSFTSQLYVYLKAYTSGAARTLLLANGTDKAIEAWRLLADKGRSTRE